VIGSFRTSPGVLCRLARALTNNQALRAELAHAQYLSVQTVIIPAPSLANRNQLPAYARAISNLLQMGGVAAFTQISIRIPVSDPVELIGQGPANPQQQNSTNRNSVYGQSNGNGNTGGGMAESSSIGSNRHKRMSSLSTRPTSMYQNQNQNNFLPVTPQNMRVPSGASAASSMMSARSGAAVVSHGDPSSTWEMWDTIRTLCGYHPRLSVSKLAVYRCDVLVECHKELNRADCQRST
jgi:protein arginine N-methyltransferase 5